MVLKVDSHVRFVQSGSMAPKTRRTASPVSKERPRKNSVSSGDRAADRSGGLDDLQATIGNRAVGAMVRRAPAEPNAGPGASPGSTATTNGASGPKTGATEPAAQTFVIWDGVNKREVQVDMAGAREEFENLKRLLRYLAKEIPADAQRVLEEYPYEEPKEMFAACIDALKSSATALARGDLLNAGVWANAAKKFSDIEPKAHKRFQEESALSYVGKRVGLGIIGFFQGAADTVLGIVDSAAGLFGADTGLVKWNEGRYNTIKEAYGGAAGIEHQYVNADEIGRFGGKVATGLATGKALTGAGTAGQVVMGVQAVAGVKGAIDTITELRSKGQSWADIATDPVALSQVAGAIAGVAGVGSIRSGELKQLFDQINLYASGAQFAALTGAIISIEYDTTLSDQAKFQKRLDLMADAIVVAGSTADTVHGQTFEQGTTGGGSGGSNGGESGVGGGGGGEGHGSGGDSSGPVPDGVPQHIGPEGDANLSPDVSTGVPEHIGPDGDVNVGTSDGIPEHIGPDGVNVDPQGGTQPVPVDPHGNTQPVPLPVLPHDASFPKPVEIANGEATVPRGATTAVGEEVVPRGATTGVGESLAPVPEAAQPAVEVVGPSREAMHQDLVEALARYQELNALDPSDPRYKDLFEAYRDFQDAYAELLSSHGYKPFEMIVPRTGSPSFPKTAKPVKSEPVTMAPDPHAAARAGANEAVNALLDQLRSVQEGRRLAPEDPILQAEEQRLLSDFYGAYAELVRLNGIDPSAVLDPGQTLMPK